jgi:tetratricopeptide (TPR) repeat protein
LAQQENQNNASRANQYLLLINELKKAQSLAHQGRSEEAATAYADVIKNPELPVAEKARILFSMSDANAAYGGQGIALIESAAISGEVFPTPLMQSYAKALLQVGRYEDAEETAFEILGNRSDADSAQMNFVLGVALYKQGQVNQAATYIGRAVAVNPKYQQMFKDALSN